MNANRRAVLIAGLAATAAGVAAAATRGADAAEPEADVPPPPLDGELSFDQAARDAAADDFGHILHRTPEGVLLPGSDDDVSAIVKWVGERRGRFAPQGQSHSVFGRSEVQDGIVADMSTLHTVHSVQSDRVVVDAGAKWSEVLSATLAQGRTRRC